MRIFGKLSRRERERLALQQEAQEQAPTGEAGIVKVGEIGGQDTPGPGNKTIISSVDFTDAGAAVHTADVAEEAGELATRGTGGKGTWSRLYGDALPAWLVERLEVCGFMEPTAVQAQAIETVVCQSRDALVQAYTGSGKTLSFLIPLFAVLERVRGADSTKRRLAGVQAVVVAPTRELAMQLTKVARQLAAGCEDTTLFVMSVSSDATAKRQRVWLKADPPQVVIGDPESLLKLCEAGTLRTGSIRFLVVDEVDACFRSSKTKQDLNRLLSRFLTSRKSTGDVEQRRTVFASATVREHTHFIQMCEKNKWLLDPVHVYVDPTVKVPPSIRHTFITSKVQDKARVVLNLCRSLAAAQRPAVIVVFADETRESWNQVT